MRIRAGLPGQPCALASAERYRSGRNGGASKASCRASGTWVRIPPSPPPFARLTRERATDGKPASEPHLHAKGWLRDRMRSAVAPQARRWANPTLSAKRNDWRQQPTTRPSNASVPIPSSPQRRHCRWRTCTAPTTGWIRAGGILWAVRFDARLRLRFLEVVSSYKPQVQRRSVDRISKVSLDSRL